MVYGASFRQLGAEGECGQGMSFRPGVRGRQALLRLLDLLDTPLSLVWDLLFYKYKFKNTVIYNNVQMSPQSTRSEHINLRSHMS
jgi:hypothetical protein